MNLTFPRHVISTALWTGFSLPVFYLLSLHHFLLFHVLIEFASVVVSVIIFLLCLHLRRLHRNEYLTFLGIAHGYVAVIQLLHTVAYKGMGIFPEAGANLPTQLWIAARYLESLSLIAAPLFLSRELPFLRISALYALVTASLLASIFVVPVFPECFIEGAGLTPFKIVSEYLVCLFLAASLIPLRRRHGEFEVRVFRMIVYYVGAGILAELAFTFYVSVYGLSNFFAHVLRLVSLSYLYRAFVVTNLETPFSLMFHHLRVREDELRHSEARWRSLVENAPEIITILDRDGTVRFINRPFSEVGRESFPGKSLADIMAPADVERIREAAVAVAAGGAIRRVETNMTEPSGAVRYYLHSLSAIHVDHDLDGILMISMDISERRQARHALENEKALLQTILDATTEGILTTDEHRRIIHANQRFHDMWRIPLEWREIATHYDLVPLMAEQLERPESFRESADRLYTSTETDTTTLSFVDGREIERFTRPLWRGGRMVGRVWCYRDMTRHKELEKSLRESEERLRVRLDFILSPRKDMTDIGLMDLFDSGELQRLQDAFANANLVMSIITDEEGNRLTHVSLPSALGKTIRDMGFLNCPPFFREIGRMTFGRMAPTFEMHGDSERIYSSAPIVVGGRHIANWIIADLAVVEDNAQGREREERFAHAVRLSWIMARQLSSTSYNNLKLARDLETLRRVETALQDSEQRYRALVENSPDIIIRFDRECRHLFVNHAIRRATGRSESDFIGKTYRELRFEEPLCRFWESVIASAFAMGRPVEEEFMIQGPAGQLVFNWRIYPEYDDKGRVVTVLSIGRDVTAQRHAERDYARLFDSMIEGFAIHEMIYNNDGIPVDYRFLSVNPSFERLTGLKAVDITGRTVREILPDTEPFWIETYDRITRTGEPVHFENYSQTLGQYYEVTAYRFSENRFATIFMDQTQRKSTEVELFRSREILRLQHDIATIFLTEGDDTIHAAILDRIREYFDSPHGFFGYIDDNGNFFCPPDAMSNWDECGMMDSSIPFVRSHWGGAWGRSLREGITLMVNEGLTPPLGHLPLTRAILAPILHRGVVIGLIGIANRTTSYTEADMRLLEGVASQVAPVLKSRLDEARYDRDREKLENQLRQTQKMEAIGALAGGIAHDFNNILFPIIGYAEMTREDMAEDNPAYDALSQILKAAMRAKDLVRQILTFSRQTERELRPLNPHLIVNEAVKLLQASLPATIRIDTEIEKDRNPILADPTQIHQIVMNLTTNAFHAMEEKGGVLTIRLDEMDLGPTDLSRENQIPGQYMRLSVSDTGVGMEEGLIARIFDPYFTTKERGKGTGLGLSVVHGIVLAYGGDILVRSAPGEGSTFIVRLPCVQKADGGEFMDATALVPGGNERILFVDDEESIVTLQRRLLEGLGYHVTAYTRSSLALERFLVAPGDFDLVISDITMPELTGMELTRRVRTVRPDIPIILCTGFSERIDEAGARELGVRSYLLKPIIRRELAFKIREALDDPSVQDDDGMIIG